MGSVSMGFITHLPETKRGHTSIYVVVERLTKMVHIMPLHNTVSGAGAAVAQLHVDNFVKLHGFPLDVVCDRDSKFTSILRSLRPRWARKRISQSDRGFWIAPRFGHNDRRPAWP